MMLRSILGAALSVILVERASAQIAGIEAELVMGDLMVQSTGNENESQKAVDRLVECSAFFNQFRVQASSRQKIEQGAREGLVTMEESTRDAAVLIWSRHSPYPASEVDGLRAEALVEASDMLEATGVENVSFLQRYDICSQAFLFSQFYMETARETIGGIKGN